MKVRAWLAAGVLAWAGVAQAAGYAVVDAVQAPAWVERGESRQPLAPGMELRNHDRLVTGAGARAVVQLADGSAVKLGENAQMGVNALGKREGGVFTAAFDVAKGAFRLTTDIFRKYQTRRAINIRAGTVTAGVRGTDLWGKSDSEKDLICLLEGRIVVSHPQGEATELSEPLQYYAAAKGEAPGPVSFIDQEQLMAWAAQTELQDGVGTAKRGGRWAVTLTTAESQAAALEVYDRAVASGVAPKIRPVKGSDESYRYELSVRQIASEAQARQVAERLARELDIPAPRVIRR
ncbi:MAG TPA: FecR family protein [Rhodocyclaceae bacterium]|nr:FecR family protein [Rhodocyclaceae bacterium]